MTTTSGRRATARCTAEFPSLASDPGVTAVRNGAGEVLLGDGQVDVGAVVVGLAEAIGQLDEDALFYMRARGIPLGQARTMSVAMTPRGAP